MSERERLEDALGEAEAWESEALDALEHANEDLAAAQSACRIAAVALTAFNALSGIEQEETG